MTTNTTRLEDEAFQVDFILGDETFQAGLALENGVPQAGLASENDVPQAGLALENSAPQAGLASEDGNGKHDCDSASKENDLVSFETINPYKSLWEEVLNSRYSKQEIPFLTDELILHWWSEVVKKEASQVWDQETSESQKKKEISCLECDDATTQTRHHRHSCPSHCRHSCLTRLVLFLLSLSSNFFQRFSYLIQRTCLEDEVRTTQISEKTMYYKRLKTAVMNCYRAIFINVPCGENKMAISSSSSSSSLPCLSSLSSSSVSSSRPFVLQHPHSVSHHSNSRQSLNDDARLAQTVWRFTCDKLPVFLFRVFKSFLPATLSRLSSSTSSLSPSPSFSSSSSSFNPIPFFNCNPTLSPSHILTSLIRASPDFYAAGSDLLFDVFYLPRTPAEAPQWRRYDIYLKDGSSKTLVCMGREIAQSMLAISYKFLFAYQHSPSHHRPSLSMVFLQESKGIATYVLIVAHAAYLPFAELDSSAFFTRDDENNTSARNYGCLGIWAGCSDLDPARVICYTNPGFQTFFETGIQPLWKATHRSFLERILRLVSKYCFTRPILHAHHTYEKGILEEEENIPCRVLYDYSKWASAPLSSSLSEQEKLKKYFSLLSSRLSFGNHLAGKASPADWMDEIGAARPIQTYVDHLSYTQQHECMCYNAICTPQDAFCTICQNASLSRYLRLFCGHHVHANCLVMYILNARHATNKEIACPLCQQSIMPIDQDCILDGTISFAFVEEE